MAHLLALLQHQPRHACQPADGRHIVELGQPDNSQAAPDRVDSFGACMPTICRLHFYALGYKPSCRGCCEKTAATVGVAGSLRRGLGMGRSVNLVSHLADVVIGWFHGKLCFARLGRPNKDVTVEARCCYLRTTRRQSEINKDRAGRGRVED